MNKGKTIIVLFGPIELAIDVEKNYLHTGKDENSTKIPIFICWKANGSEIIRAKFKAYEGQAIMVTAVGIQLTGVSLADGKSVMNMILPPLSCRELYQMIGRIRRINHCVTGEAVILGTVNEYKVVKDHFCYKCKPANSTAMYTETCAHNYTTVA